MKIKFTYFLVLFGGAILFGCYTAQQHAERVQSGIQGEKLTVGTVQRSIKEGMSGAEVIEVLGSPNIVSTDSERNEVWVYDKMSTTTTQSSSNSSFWYVSPAGAISKNQKTLTVIIKFDKNKEVSDFSYRQSSF